MAFDKRSISFGGMEKGLHDRDRVGVQDAVLLEDYTNEQAFIDNTKKRFKENIIYTYIGHVLVSVNPYCHLPIYGQDYVELFHKKHFFENPPHVFAITEGAYINLIEEQKNQCILISGESGSGKTEASKKVLEYIAAVTGNRGHVQTVKDKLLLSNPVLEAFGNAKTNRNDNSSRFGKYMDIQFNYLGDPIGGNILNYLLEKSRVVHQNPGERNFHIFYQLLTSDRQMLDKLQLEKNPSNYHYFNQSSGSLDNIDDSSQMKTVLNAMDKMGLSQREQDEILAIVGSILHFGNITVRDANGKSEVSNRYHLEAAAKLLGCESSDLADALTHRTFEARNDFVKSPLDLEMAVYARDALAKAVYDRLFSWLVSRINVSLQPEETTKKKTVLGILDIYGFEIFQQNSFEQFCINYCNEKLQQVFIELTLKSEQEEYLKEGIEWEPVEYFNNTIICNLIEEKHKGIISIIDEECLRPGDTTDLTFLQKMETNLSNHKHFISHKKADIKAQKIMSREEFKLVHYAGEVTYNVNGFLDKNNDLLFRDLREVMSKTNNSITKRVFPKSDLECKKRPDTAVNKFKISLNKLIEILMSKVPSYIRCVKPNDFKKSGEFNEAVVGHQVKYLGLMENLRVRRAGFAYRRCYEDFIRRYKSLCPKTWPNYSCSHKQAVQYLAEHLNYQPNDYRMGKTKIFIRHATTLFDTEDAFQAKKHELAAIIQSHWKGLLQRRKYQKMREAAIVIESWIRRFLAQKLAERRRKAVIIIRNFIEGFITRHDIVTDLNLKFIQSAKQQYLMRLAKHLPPSVLSKSWPTPPECCKQASQELRVIYRNWLARKYRLNLTPEKKRQFELKVLAESIFKDKKKSYGATIEQWFQNNRLNETQNMLKNSFIANDATHEKLVYCTEVAKFDRHGYKKRFWLMIVTDQNLYLLMENKKHLKLKHQIPLSSVIKYEITSEKDSFLLIRIPMDLTKGKGDLILEVPYLIEALTIITSLTSNPGTININNIENGCITHHMAKGKEKIIDLTKGMDGIGISKGKTGNLIIVG